MGEKAERLLKRLANMLVMESHFKVSINNVPYLIVHGRQHMYNICYFGARKLFKIFYPGGGFCSNQRKISAKTIGMTANFLNSCYHKGVL